MIHVPYAKATKVTMDHQRDQSRALSAKELNLPTSKFAFANSEQEYLDV